MVQVNLSTFRNSIEHLLKYSEVNNHLGGVMLSILTDKIQFMGISKPNNSIISNDILDDVVSDVVLIMLAKLPTLKFDTSRSDKELMKYLIISCVYALKTERRRLFRANSREQRDPLGRMYEITPIDERGMVFEQDLNLALDIATTTRINGDAVDYNELIKI